VPQGLILNSNAVALLDRKTNPDLFIWVYFEGGLFGFEYGQSIKIEEKRYLPATMGQTAGSFYIVHFIVKMRVSFFDSALVQLGFLRTGAECTDAPRVRLLDQEHCSDKISV